MNRRAFIAGATAALACPLRVRAQPARHTIGILRNTSPAVSAHLIGGFHRGLKESGFTAGENVEFIHRWGDGRQDGLPPLAAELVRLGPTILFAGGSGEALALKAATATIPIVFTGGSDPVEIGLVSSLNRPGSHITGATTINHALGAKRIGMLQQVLPDLSLVALLINPRNPSAASYVKTTQEAAAALGLQTIILEIPSEQALAPAYSDAARRNVGAVIVGPDPLLNSRRTQLIQLAEQHKLPAMYPLREYALEGGLFSYGASIVDSWRQAGSYVGRILKGEKAGDLPVLQPVRFELVINLKAAKTAGLTFPQNVILIADEVID